MSSPGPDQVTTDFGILAGGLFDLKNKTMNEYDVRRLALVLAVQAEIEGMKAENADREMKGHSQAYSDQSFADKAEELRSLAYAHNEQLFN